MQIKVIAIDTKNYKFTNEEEVLGILKYKSWFSIAATVILIDTNIFEIKRRKLLDHIIDVYHEQDLMYTCDLTHKGGISIESPHQKYILKKRESLSNIYSLETMEQKCLMEISHTLNLQKISREFTINIHTENISPNELYTLPFIAVHGVNYSLSSHIGAGNFQ